MADITLILSGCTAVASAFNLWATNRNGRKIKAFETFNSTNREVFQQIVHDANEMNEHVYKLYNLMVNLDQILESFTSLSYHFVIGATPELMRERKSRSSDMLRTRQWALQAFKENMREITFVWSPQPSISPLITVRKGTEKKAETSAAISTIAATPAIAAPAENAEAGAGDTADGDTAAEKHQQRARSRRHRRSSLSRSLFHSGPAASGSSSGNPITSLKLSYCRNQDVFAMVFGLASLFLWLENRKMNRSADSAMHLGEFKEGIEGLSYFLHTAPNPLLQVPLIHQKWIGEVMHHAFDDDEDIRQTQPRGSDERPKCTTAEKGEKRAAAERNMAAGAQPNLNAFVKKTQAWREVWSHISSDAHEPTRGAPERSENHVRDIVQVAKLANFRALKEAHSFGSHFDLITENWLKLVIQLHDAQRSFLHLPRVNDFIGYCVLTTAAKVIKRKGICSGVGCSCLLCGCLPFCPSGRKVRDIELLAQRYNASRTHCLIDPIDSSIFMDTLPTLVAFQEALDVILRCDLGRADQTTQLYTYMAAKFKDALYNIYLDSHVRGIGALHAHIKRILDDTETLLIADAMKKRRLIDAIYNSQVA